MGVSTPISLEKDFDDFLFAPIGEDGNGMLLSVVSALTRLDLDPWQVARDLSRMPAAAAIDELEAVIAMLPNRVIQGRDQSAIALRLAALLPRRILPIVTPQLRWPPARLGDWKRFMPDPRIVLCAMVFCLFVLAHFLASGSNPVPPSSAGVHLEQRR